MPSINLPPIEELDVDDLVSLPEGYRYELHNGNLVIMTPSIYWHKWMAQRLVELLRMAGLEAFQDTGVRGERPRDNRIPDVGAINIEPSRVAEVANLPGSAFRMVAEIVSENSVNGEYTYKAQWYAERGIPEYWVVDRTLDRAPDDAVVHLFCLTLAESNPPSYVLSRKVTLSELEGEYRAKFGKL